MGRCAFPEPCAPYTPTHPHTPPHTPAVRERARAAAGRRGRPPAQPPPTPQRPALPLEDGAAARTAPPRSSGLKQTLAGAREAKPVPVSHQLRDPISHTRLSPSGLC